MIIPQPEKIEVQKGNFQINEKTVISVDKKTKKIGEYIADELRISTGLPLPVKNCDSDKNQISLKLIDDNKLREEGYELISTPDGVKISANKPAGLFYGCQSLRQLLPPENFSDHGAEAPRNVAQTSSSAIIDAKKVAGDGDPPNKINEGTASPASLFSRNVRWEIPCVSISDKPRFKWRGLMLDSCRHFFDVEFVKKFVDLMAVHKLNTFHWHLTEDQGWRIEIKKYPKLTEVGAWRNEDGKKYGGFYTQDQIREIIKYADDRFITVVPEIEMPGHSVAAIAAYPELSCRSPRFSVSSSKKPIEVPTTWGVFENVYCAGKENTFKFLENVLSEVIELFPGKFIHIGGDECPKANWSKCPKCQTRIKNENLKNEHELQSYFIKKIEKFINKNNKRLIGWDEILEGGLAPNAAVMSWRGMDGGIAAAKEGHDVVMSPTSHCYFNEDQKDRIPIEKAYGFEPVPKELTPKQAKHILGGQANLWTEHITEPSIAEEMLYPRTCALSEALWSSKTCSDWENFKKRLEIHLKRLDVLNVNYYKLC